jgi:hypothetical protein
MFGIKSREPNAANLVQLEAVLDRQVPIDSLEALFLAVDRRNKKSPELEKVAIGIDSSVFLRLASHKHSADIVDYLDTKHLGPLILPGQAVQEFWNNQLAAVDTVAAGVKKKFDALKLDVAKVDPNFGDYAESMGSLLEQFSSDYGYVYDAATLRTTTFLLELLKKKAFLSYVPRMRFHEIALSRKRTKTPPGFKDDGDGDFFVWVEFLYGLLHAKDQGPEFDHAIILTHDQKIDWSRASVAHPVLAAEVQKLVGVPFDVWTIERFYQAMMENSSEVSQTETVET